MNRSYFYSSLVALLFLISCSTKKEGDYRNVIAPNVVEAHGYVVPDDSVGKPKVVLVDESKWEKKIAGKPIVIPANANIYPAGIPKNVVAGNPTVIIPGQDTFSLPKTVTAIDSPFVAGIPEITIAKDAHTKDQNPQNFSSFGKLQGLKHGQINCLLQDKSGNIWIGTNGGGVSKYDGRSFTTFTEKEGLSKGNNNIFSMLEDKNGNLWFGSHGGGVSKYDGKSFTIYTEKEGLSNGIVLSMLQDKSGALWFGTDGGGVSKFDGKSFTNFTQKEGLSNDHVLSIAEDKSGALWFGTAGGGISKYDGKSFTNFTQKEGLCNNHVSSLLEDRSGYLWIGTNGGFSKYDGRSFTNFTKKEGLSDDRVLSILQDKSGNLWFGTTGGGISKYDGRSFTHFTDKEGLSNTVVLSLLEDKSGNLWCGTNGGGVSKFDGKSFTHFTEIEGLSNSVVLSILQDKSGNLWLGTYGGGVSKYDGKSFTHFTDKEGLCNNHILSMLEDKSGNLWFGTYRGGVSKYDGRSFTHVSEKDGLTDSIVLSMLQDKSGNIWFGTYAGGVSKYDGKSFTNFTEKEGLSNNAIVSMLQDKRGDIWFATDGGGVTKYDGKSFTRFAEKEGLKDVVFSMLEDQSGNLWFGTNGGGLAKYDGKSFTYFTEKDGLSNNVILSMIMDKSGNLWFGTRFGISKLSKERQAAVSDNARLNPLRERNVLFKKFTYEDGFLGIGCWSNSLCEDKKGNIWIGTNDRLTVYHPEGDLADTVPPNIQLVSLQLFNENVAWVNLEKKKDSVVTLGNGEKVSDYKFDDVTKWYGLPQNLSLAYNNNYLTFNFIGITQKSPKKVKYQYTLEGNDDNWSALTNNTQASYGNLPQGTYIFKAKAMNSEGYWSNEFNYRFKIRPSWWKTWWAYTLYALCFIAILLYGYRVQRKRVIEKERSLAKEKELAHAKEIEKAYHELKATQAQLIQSEKMASLGELTAGIAHEIQNPLNFVNNFSEVNKELLIELKDEITKGNMDEVNAIADDVISNEEKINHHGKRADAIVKGMLQHSRSSSGVKEPTDINALADEYLRLAYHGLRAKDKSFNATMKTDFDESIGNVNIVPQDMGRVILNLITNAFYVVNEKKNQGLQGYEPIVSVSTKKVGNKVEIKVADNGNGIPQKILDKIFQPFFTTKPTGQGTGLGLSLSYDIIKAHGGELKAETKEGEGAEFIIRLPCI